MGPVALCVSSAAASHVNMQQIVALQLRAGRGGRGLLIVGGVLCCAVLQHSATRIPRAPHVHTYAMHSQERSLLVAVGLEEPGVSSAAVKMWEADRVITAAAAAAAAAASAAAAAAALGAAPSAAAGSGGAASGAPAATVAATSAPATLQPLRSHKLFGGGGGSSSRQPESEVTSLAVDDACGSSQLLLAIGVAAGAVHLLATDASAPRGKLHHIARLSARQEPGELSRVVALAFLRPQQQQQQQQKHLPALTAAPKTAPRNTSAQSTVTSSTSTRTTPGNDGAGTASGTPPDAATTHGAAGAPGAPWLLVVTQDQTLSFQLGTSTASGTPGETAVRSILDQQGLSSGACSTTVRDLLVVARDDALYEYALDTRAGCTAFEGECRDTHALGVRLCRDMRHACKQHVCGMCAYIHACTQPGMLYDLSVIVSLLWCYSTPYCCPSSPPPPRCETGAWPRRSSPLCCHR